MIPLTSGQLEDYKRRLHFPDGYAPRSGKVVAVCHCGWTTTPRVTRERAHQALLDGHGFTGRNDKNPATCGICALPSRWWLGDPWPWELFQVLKRDGRPYVTPAAEGAREVFVCRNEKACHARYEARRRADQLKCGCHQSTVQAIGHYHDTK